MAKRIVCCQHDENHHNNFVPLYLTGQQLRRATREENQRYRQQCQAGLKHHLSDMPKDYSSPRILMKSSNFFSFYACNTFRGMIRETNEDKICAITNISRWNGHEEVKCQFFGIYDGHGGSSCSQFLQQNLHDFIFSQDCLLTNPTLAITQGFQQAQDEFVQQAMLQSPIDSSGSCAIICLLIQQQCFIANTGDCRAIVSYNQGSNILQTRDHKPGDLRQQERILAMGGKIFQTKMNTKTGEKKGPLRIFPGRLSLSRAFGDIESKLPEYGGVPRMLVHQPEILSFKIDETLDFVLMGCDGIFDKMSSQEVANTVWNCQKKRVEQFAKNAVSQVMERAICKGSTDNLSVMLLGFPGFLKLLKEEQLKKTQ